LGTSWCECVHQVFVRVESALVSSALTELLDLAIESMGQRKPRVSFPRSPTNGWNHISRE
jgi:hypothetical protein